MQEDNRDNFSAQNETADFSSEQETAEAEKTERELRELKEAGKMKFRKVLYPIAIILIIALWVSSFWSK